MEMECCPARSPFNACSRLLGGNLRSSSDAAASSILNRRNAAYWISNGSFRLRSPNQIRLASSSLNDLIIATHRTKK